MNVVHNQNESKYLACERKLVFVLLITSAGMMGAYTLKLRGGVFCNAQTANFVMMAVALGDEKWKQGFYYIIPICAYLSGAIVSEILPKPIKKMGLFRWDTYLIGFEMIALFGVGFIPLSVSDHVVQVLINFICSMQYNTFRQAESIPMATTFCTNHLRQTGVCIVKYIKKRDKDILSRGVGHAVMILCFFVGGVIETVACRVVKEKAIWLALVPLLIDFLILAYADIIQERNLLEKVPSGH